ncbi:hypothetical protein Tco_0706271 [Tanacetum coccineum]|uniref:Uncharacterized protein n=1 Tax=Tanacetum coccineum TaxID=301880 RepID=A0ABQ4Y7T7_9ASTR
MICFGSNSEEDPRKEPCGGSVIDPAGGGDPLLQTFIVRCFNQTVIIAPSTEETEPFETDESTATPPPHPAYRVTARNDIPASETYFRYSLPLGKMLTRGLLTFTHHLHHHTLAHCSSHYLRFPQPPLPYKKLRDPAESRGTINSPIQLPSPIATSHVPLYTSAKVELARLVHPSTYSYNLASPIEAPPSEIPPLLPIPLPTPSPPLLLPSIDRRANVREACLPPRKRLCFAFGLRYDVGAPVTDETELGRRVTNLVTTVRQDTDEIYGRMDDAQTELTQSVNQFACTGDRPQITEPAEIAKDTTERIDSLRSPKDPLEGPAELDWQGRRQVAVHKIFVYLASYFVQAY